MEIYRYHYYFSFKLKGLGVGDPQILTYDGFNYTFNGYGQFILTKTIDSSFEIQAETSIFTNILNPSILATFFSKFAFKTDSSPVVQLDLSNSTSPNPYFGII